MNTEFMQVIAETRAIAEHSTPMRYITLIMLKALEDSCGSTEKAFETLKAASDNYTDQAPDELKPMVGAIFVEYFRGIANAVNKESGDNKE